jgi:type IV pilus assembly protein PilY1
MTPARPFFRAGTFARRALAATTLALGCATALAEDIDIFTGNPPPGESPNILIILDSSSNWSATLGPNTCNAGLTKFDAEICALTKAINSFTSNVRLGLMMFAESGENGGYVRYAVRDLGTETADAIANKKAFVDMLNGFVRLGSGTDNSGSNQPYGKVMFEAFKYFGGGDIAGCPQGKTGCGPVAFAGWTSDSGGNIGARRRDYAGNGNATPAVSFLPTGERSATLYGADKTKSAFSDKNSNVYQSPITKACPKNFIIFISNGNPGTGGDAGGTATAEQLLKNVGGNTAQISSAGSAIHASMMDEWARFLWNTDVSTQVDQQKIITSTIAVYQPTGWLMPDGKTIVKTEADCGTVKCTPIASNTDQQMINLMRSAATAGGGLYFDATDASKIEDAFQRLLNDVQAENSVFVSASLPVSVNTQGTYLNQVYMGMFRPEEKGEPRWLGNLKQYKILQDPAGNLFLADSANVNAINPDTGFVSPVAKSFWSSASEFWKNSPSGTPESISDLPDGAIVEKGGAAEQLRIAHDTTQAKRRIYTCADSGCSTGPLGFEFSNSNIVGGSYQSLFGVGNADELALMVDWVRGEDNFNGRPCDATIITSPLCKWTTAERGPGWKTTVRPSAHGDVLHSRPVVLNYPDSSASPGPFIFYGANDGTLRGTKGGRAAADGSESWAFVAPEFFGKFKRLRNNEPFLKLPGTLDPDALPKDYFMDGPIGSYQSPDLKNAYIFATARRGGRVIYAFDVSDPTNPSLMWKVTEKEFPELGQTWSEPKAFTVRGATPAAPRVVVMFGAGYDPTEDSLTPGLTTMGRGVFVLDALTGKELKFFQASENGPAISSSVPSDIAVIDRDFDTLADRAYVGDMAGNVWRMDLDDADPTKWKMYQLAALGPRKFFFRPDVVVSKEFDLVLVGSGDREKPTDQKSQERFYMLKDVLVGKSGAGMVITTAADLLAGGMDLSAAKGWYLDMRVGEKVVNAPLSIGGITYFSTNRPTPDPLSCSPNLGEARAYAVDFLTGTAGVDRNGDGTTNADDISIKLTGGGLPPSPVGGVVQLDDGRLVDFIIGSGAGGSPITPEKPVRNIPKIRTKIYWNTNSDK